MKQNNYLKEMGDKIKAARKAKKIGLPKLSKLTGIDKSNLWLVERGERNTKVLTLRSIADVLGVDVKDLI